MYTYKITNPASIKNAISKGLKPEEIKEITFKVDSPELFLDSILEDFGDWPLAVPYDMIVDPSDEVSCNIRARNIVDLTIEQDIYGLKILDCGCGDGYVSHELLMRGASQVVGFDLSPGKAWMGKSLFTTDWKTVADNGPYDIILLYDVLDHVMDREPSDLLIDCNKVLKGQMIVRCHPWIGRHGAHLYTSLNRAWAHVVFPEEKLKSKGYVATPTRKVIHPMMTYKKWFTSAGLKIVKEDKLQEPVEDYFLKNDLLRDCIQLNYNNSPMDDYREGTGDLSRVMSFHFIDFILQK
jgi:2-polyprenyl-3-methyl-5-hydroxy-6-metoxy-1,4-benzoquinol methylase